MSSKDLEEHKKKLEVQRRVFAQARAFIQRGKRAGIPDKYLRIKKEEFSKLLDPTFHKNSDEFSKEIYNTPQILFKKPFIVIDGGDIYSRKKAGFAILFRMIACDYYGAYYDCSSLAGQFQVIKFGKDENRNDLVKKIKDEQIIFINEFNPKNFSVHLDSGTSFDQILEHRDDYSKPTIVTFALPLAKGMSNRNNAIKDDRCGNYFAMLSHVDLQENENVFRIKLK